MDEKPRDSENRYHEAIEKDGSEPLDSSGKPAAIDIELKPTLKEAEAYETGIPQSTEPPQLQDQGKDKT